MDFTPADAGSPVLHGLEARFPTAQCAIGDERITAMGYYLYRVMGPDERRPRALSSFLVGFRP